MTERQIAGMRTEYARQGLDEADLLREPVAQFEKWFREAVEAGVREPNAMTLATASPKGEPSARVVLLKGVDEAGFRFFTNRSSDKGRELASNARAALVFFWPDLERQVRIKGHVDALGHEEVDAYFASRPRGSQLGAWASRQSAVIPSRGALEERLAETSRLWDGREVSTPPFWGGYRVVPYSLEFWQGRPNRLHDRLRYERTGDMPWRVERLSP